MFASKKVKLFLLCASLLSLISCSKGETNVSSGDDIYNLFYRYDAKKTSDTNRVLFYENFLSKIKEFEGYNLEVKLYGTSYKCDNIKTFDEEISAKFLNILFDSIFYELSIKPEYVGKEIGEGAPIYSPQVVLNDRQLGYTFSINNEKETLKFDFNNGESDSLTLYNVYFVDNNEKEINYSYLNAFDCLVFNSKEYKSYLIDLAQSFFNVSMDEYLDPNYYKK